LPPLRPAGNASDAFKGQYAEGRHAAQLIAAMLASIRQEYPTLSIEECFGLVEGHELAKSSAVVNSGGGGSASICATASLIGGGSIPAWPTAREINDELKAQGAE
jgi:hypothetical protein